MWHPAVLDDTATTWHVPHACKKERDGISKQHCLKLHCHSFVRNLNFFNIGEPIGFTPIFPTETVFKLSFYTILNVLTIKIRIILHLRIVCDLVDRLIINTHPRTALHTLHFLVEVKKVTWIGYAPLSFVM